MKIEEKELIKFLEGNNKSHFLQSPEWAKVKTEWKNEFIIIKDENGNIKGTMSILLRKVPIFKRYIMYAPRGFVCDIKDKKTLKELTKRQKRLQQPSKKSSTRSKKLSKASSKRQRTTSRKRLIPLKKNFIPHLKKSRRF